MYCDVFTVNILRVNSCFSLSCNRTHDLAIYIENFYAASTNGCEDLLSPLNGYREIEGSGIGSIATYRCQNGFVLVGKAQRFCTRGRRWSGSVPTCRSSGHAHIILYINVTGFY